MSEFSLLPLSRLPSAARQQAAALYWGAFKGKLGRLLGPETRALRLINGVMQVDHGIAAIAPSGEIIGIAGFRSALGTFVPLSPSAIRVVYGRFGAIWRLAALQMISEIEDSERFLIEGLAVAPAWQGRGIGTLLIAALAEEARARGYEALRLDVADQNIRARLLYERLGFEVAAHHRLWLMAPVFGMTGSKVMTRSLGPA